MMKYPNNENTKKYSRKAYCEKFQAEHLIEKSIMNQSFDIIWYNVDIGQGEKMKIYVGMTDYAWFCFHKAAKPDEVNVGKPRDKCNFKAIAPGELFLFKASLSK